MPESTRSVGRRRVFRWRAGLACGWTCLLLVGCVSGSAPVQSQPADFAAQRAAIAAAYFEDPVAYWAQHGLPPLCQLSELLERKTADRLSAFRELEAEIESRGVSDALSGQSFPPLLSHRVQELAAAEPDTEDLVLKLLLVACEVVGELDAASSQEDPDSATLEQLQGELRYIADILFGPGSGDCDFAPEPEKIFASTPSEIPDVLCPGGSDRYSADLTPEESRSGGLPADTDVSKQRKWTELFDVYWKTTYNGSCASQAVGPCGVRLRFLKDEVTCKDWNDLSRAIGAEAGKSGASMSGIGSYLRSKGYCAALAWDGFLESACQEAKKALGRSCDVLLDYTSDDGSAGHLEMVTGITVNKSDSRKCTVSTLSWGSAATVTYSSGRYSNKSDGEEYRSGNEKSYLEGTGRARLYYYCKC